MNSGEMIMKKISKKEQEILGLIGKYGGTDGAHHKQWLLDQIVREITGKDYEKWVSEYEDGEDGPETYLWDKGIAP